MANNWIAKTLGKIEGDGNEDNEDLLVLIQGRNAFNDRIYCYLKIISSQLEDLKEKIQNTANFDLREYGTVVAAGRGEPTVDIQAEVTQDLGIKPSGKP